ncbi:amyloid-beta A4 precursor protein-binding family A member 2-like [Sapajus apella]|uniref:Amyloid-beta A4 precursor protein-binding family A member 2-like n=1 Tax=Sapajus apella TaxID=9515 RepID=A0A6J3FFF6_SAPAP|nr:amyloid-beta A4 precursor protein-binding family A member 2-like [Sapajus apella]XP_032104346.1 amyloid-beta A4 precursor protein-binding family A member 2-like [Sapajus apella]XP_032104347.1 amyloid-beta A4 precursor protein-binding family A member 2-like [Sapajus apella]XP_032104348.1 amyloid-beta A4 precursor protein-binding family A member 2-like [Sapajus apella]XP_032104349.1 amyloid-beta A4 precursor protein-binding family A member 2-like [Sapajus apella]
MRAQGVACWTMGRGWSLYPTARSEDVELPLEAYGPNGDSRSNYVNNTPEEEDHNEGLPKEEEGITYYICYSPKENSYLEGMDCNGDEYLVHGTHPVDTDKCQEHLHNMPRNWTSEELSPH